MKVEYVAFTGGLDYATSALAVDPGKLSECQNFEQVFGKQGYRRMDGYERFDGRPEPHKASYWTLRFKQGADEIVAGDVITGAAASATVVLVVLESGSWASGTAAGVLVLDLVAGSFVNDENLSEGPTFKAKADGVLVPGSVSEPNNATYLQAAVARRRSVIQPVPGEGPILGVAVYRNEVYAVRNAVGGQSATLWKSSPTGWTSVRAGLYPGGRYRFEVANFSGASTTVALFGVNSKGRLFRWDGSTFTFAAPIFGTEALSNTSVAIGTGSKTFTLTTTARSYTTGQELLIWSTANAANRMKGTITSYNSGINQLVVNVTETNGSGTFTDWEMCLSDFRDRPYELTAHKDHMWLAYPLGQLQTSNIGDPMTYTTSAALFGLGDDITGLTSPKGSVLGVFCRNKIELIGGSALTDWNKETHSTNTGARFWTVQENNGNAIFLDEKGITTLQASQNFGAFEVAIFSRNVKPYLDRAAPSVIGSRMVKNKYQYRLYFASGEVLTCAILSPNAVLQPRDVSFTRQKLKHIPTVFASGELSDTEVGYFFGTTDGYVMREDVGTSFDGEPISAALRLHFNQFKSPSNRKRFQKLVLELEAESTVAINFRQQFDFADGFYATGLNQEATAVGEGGAWNVSGWDTFYWSQPLVSQAEANIDGVGRNMTLILSHESGVDVPYTLQGLLVHYNVLGLQR